MNGSEALSVARPESGFFSKPPELTPAEQMDLVNFSVMPVSKTVYKLMEQVVIESRDRAMETDPAEEFLQRANMTIAHAQHAFYKAIRHKIELTVGNHIAETKIRAAEAEMEDVEKIHEIVLQQSMA